MSVAMWVGTILVRASLWLSRHSSGRLARGLLEAAVSRAPGESPARLALAWQLIQDGEPQAVESCLAPLLRAVPACPEAWSLLGRAFQMLDRPHRAAEAFRRAIASGATDWRNYSALGGNLVLAGQPVEALKAYDAALQLVPDEVDVWAASGITLLELGRWQEAVTRLRRARALCEEPERELLIRLAEALQQIGEYDEATTALHDALGLADDASHVPRRDVLTALAELQAARGQFDDAVATLAPVRSRLDASGLALLSGLLLNAGRLADATEAADAAVAADARSAAAHGAQGLLHLEAGDGVEAAKAFERALSLHGGEVATAEAPPPNRLRLWLTAGRAAALTVTGHATEARRLCEALERVDPGFLDREPDWRRYFEAARRDIRHDGS